MTKLKATSIVVSGIGFQILFFKVQSITLFLYLEDGDIKTYLTELLCGVTNAIYHSFRGLKVLSI